MPLNENNITEFYAMEYVNVIGNRILKVWISDKYVFAAKVKGMTSEGVAIFEDSKFIIHHSKRNDPKAYANPNEVIKYDHINFNTINPDEFISINLRNFVISKQNIKSVLFNPKKKWGMGTYPHNGRIIVKADTEASNKKRKREFILIGIQDEKPLLSRLNIGKL